MSIQAVAWVLEHSEATLADRLVLIAIANHADARGWNAWPAVPQIAKEARVDRATVYRAIDALEDSGELIVERRPGKSNMYGIAALRGSQDATGEGVANCDGRGRILSQKGSQSATRTIKNRPLTNGDAPRIRQPNRCLDCGQLEFDCLCGRGPLIQGVGRR